MNEFMWIDDRLDFQMKNASNQVEEFFEGLKKNNASVIQNKGIKLTYRVGQHKFSTDVMTAIRENQILIVQAGVGIGKSMGYLIPIFQTIHQVSSFNSIVISTSNIALQQQLLTDIHFISNLLGIEIKVAIAKGINNYVCLKRMDDLLSTSSLEDKRVLLELKHDMEKKRTIDRDQLKEVSDEVWKKVQIKSRGSCSNCIYSKSCLYRTISKDISKADIVVTNHGNFVRSIIEDRDFVKEADMFVFDEAHQLENSIIGINQGILNVNTIRENINYYINNHILEDKKSIELVSKLIYNIDTLYSNIRSNASYYFKNAQQEDRDIKITDCDRIPFNSGKFSGLIHSIVLELKEVIQCIEYRKRQRGYRLLDGKLDGLKKYLSIFKDMEKGNDSENIYWANYYKNNKIHIGYVAKTNLDITQNIFGRGIPIVCTSATLLDAKGSYQYFKNGLSFDKIQFANQSVVDGKAYTSPYDYSKNSLFYYDTTVSNPNDYKKYICDLVIKIDELIRVTNGRCLVLFTSKSTMELVYRELQKNHFDFNLMMQGEMSNAQICNKFSTDVKSCLFATGSFWEGIDIAGKSLCNVIITRLPFSHEDAVTKHKVSNLSKEDAFQMVYLNDMAQHIAQGTGRLIRSNRDKGIICCLDSRIVNYIDVIKNCTPYTEFTSDIKDVYEFAGKYITNRDGKRKVKKV